MVNTYRLKIGGLLLTSLLLILLVALQGPMPQDPAYHNFADQRALAGVPNALNVLSNLPFLLVGLYGLWRGRGFHHECTRGYLALCLGVALVGLGSTWYHLAPSTPTLLWDRLPMTIAFMALFALLLKERVIPPGAFDPLWWLLGAGIASALYWYWSELQGAGDLRLYALVQFLPMLLIPVVLLIFPRRYLVDAPLWWALGCYLLAKLLEHFDVQLLSLSGGVISGHSLKHLAAALAVLFIVRAVPATAVGGLPQHQAA